MTPTGPRRRWTTPRWTGCTPPIDRAHARADRQQSAQERAQLAHGMERRTVIGQAQGLLMARFGISAEEAYEVLVSQSQHRGDKLHDVAAAVVADHERRVRADG
ncbi:MAG TPA: ANTAR domain-containing protein [Mycobacteriales bacterium]|nr:ANTAR domain-containing protein [Mycobacteriales bacterium]